LEKAKAAEAESKRKLEEEFKRTQNIKNRKRQISYGIDFNVD
jgi:hypothetical protein